MEIILLTSNYDNQQFQQVKLLSTSEMSIIKLISQIEVFKFPKGKLFYEYKVFCKKMFHIYRYFFLFLAGTSSS